MLARAAKGDIAAWSMIREKHYMGVFRQPHTVGDAALAEESR
ncbi:MAG: hypothetical protein U0168_21835 [Nannocystaceae bacterium]